MDNRERISAATMPHLSRGIGGGAGGSSPGTAALYRNVQPNNINASRASTLERPVGRSAMVTGRPSGGSVGHQLVTTTVDVEHQRPDMRVPAVTAASPAVAANSAVTDSGSAYPAFDTNQMIKKIVIRRHDNHGFGFTLRHFIVYPPEPGSQAYDRFSNFIRVNEPMDTVFVKEVRPNGPAHVAGLKTGDRLWTVNGLPVDGMQYAHVVSIIQQVPAVLTLQIIPKEFDFLQTQFGETAHNPETNQRPKLCPASNFVGPSHGTSQVQVVPQLQQQQQQQQQSAFVAHPQAMYHQQSPMQHVTLQSPNVVAAAAAAGVQLHSPGKRRESLASISSHDSNMKEIEESNTAIAMLRLKKNIEQKEEFMRRPNMQSQQMMPFQQQGQHQQQQLTNLRASMGEANGQVMPREFYSRPKKLQRPIWPPSMEEQQQSQMRKVDQNQFVPIHNPSVHQQTMQQSKLMKSKCREQFFNMIQQQQQQQHQHQEPSNPDDSIKSDDYPIPANGLHIVSEKTKLFESGRPLSPDGSCVDRTLLYKSELSRLNQKVATPNVALRKKEYEQIHDHSDYSRLSTDTETIVSDTASVSRQLQSPPTVEVQQHQQHTVPVVVVRREPKHNASGHEGEDERRMRRISYLRATANDTNLEINNNNIATSAAATTTAGNSVKRSAAEYAENDRAMAMNVISDNRDKRRHGRQLGGDEGCGNEEAIKDNTVIVGDGGRTSGGVAMAAAVDEEMAMLLRRGNNDKRRVSSASSILALHEGPMQIKITLIDGKRSHDRSWKTVWAELKGNKLNLTVQRDGKPNQSLGGLDLHNFQVMDAADYTKRKHVFKLLSRSPAHSSSSTVGHTEILVQSENDSQMNVWRDLLQAVCDPNVLLKKDCVVSDSGNQVAEPQSTVANAKLVVETAAVSNLSDDAKTATAAGQGRKYNFGSRSPSGQSPVTKSRKTPQQLNISVGTGPSGFGGGEKGKDGGSDKEAGSPKPRAWKLLVTKQLKKIQGSPQGHGSAPVSFPEAASIGVPLQFCVPSEEDEYLPLLVARCTSIVEDKGMDIVGVYRIPGNTANITALTELVNRGFDDTTLNDHRWDDVNVVSSLLKAFLRQLPDPLIPDDQYPAFISADKKRGEVRLRELKDHLNALPVHNYHTMRHLMRHLYRVSENCAINLMDPKNIAIVFGPSVVRMSKQTLELAVKDMKHQCCIVEVLVSQYKYFFENGPMPVISEVSSPTADCVSSVPSTNLLLDNVAKLEPMGERNASSSIVGSIVQAANRKLRKSSNRKTILSSGHTPDNLSLDSSTSTDSKDVGAIYATIERRDGGDQRLKGSAPVVGSGGSGAPGDDQDQPDSLLHENGSMSLNTVTVALDNKLRTLRSSMDENTTDGEEEDDGEDTTTSVEAGGDSREGRRSNEQVKRRSAGDSGRASDGLEKRLKDEHSSVFKKAGGASSNMNKWKVKHFGKNQPLTVFDDNIPYADESPERSMIVIPGSTSSSATTSISNSTVTTTTITTTASSSSRLPIRQNSFKSALLLTGGGPATTTTTTDLDLRSYAKLNNGNNSDSIRAQQEREENLNNSDQGVDGLSSTSSDETDTSTTSSVQMTVDPEMLRKMNRILTNLERNTTKMNRSLSLNYKNVQKGGECCCHVNHRLTNRGPGSSGLTKDEKTDKNNMKKRHSQESSLNAGGGGVGVVVGEGRGGKGTMMISGSAGSGGVVARRYGNRSIRRRHTVGGTHDYSPRIGGGGENYRTPCHNYVMHRSSSPE